MMDRLDHQCACISPTLQMIENQEELRTAQNKIRGLEEEIRVLRHQKSELEERQLGGSSADGNLPSQELQNQARMHFCSQIWEETFI